MTANAATAFLLATLDDDERLKAMRRGFMEQAFASHTTELIVVGLIVAALAALALAAFHLSHRKTRPVRQIGPVEYLTRAAAELALSGTETRDLRTLANRARLPHPVSMLLSPANLAHALYAAQADARLHHRVHQLSLKLFGVGLVPSHP